MPATLERLTAPEIYLLRQGPNHVRYGDDWLISAVVERFGKHVIVKGACNLSVGHEYLLDIRSIRAEFKRLGIETAQWERSQEGIFIKHSMNV